MFGSWTVQCAVVVCIWSAGNFWSCTRTQNSMTTFVDGGNLGTPRTMAGFFAAIIFCSTSDIAHAGGATIWCMHYGAIVISNTAANNKFSFSKYIMFTISRITQIPCLCTVPYTTIYTQNSTRTSIVHENTIRCLRIPQSQLRVRTRPVIPMHT